MLMLLLLPMFRVFADANPSLKDRIAAFLLLIGCHVAGVVDTAGGFYVVAHASARGRALSRSHAGAFTC